MGVGFSVFASTVLALESPSSEERFKKIEDQLTTLRDENQQLRQQLGVESKSPAAFARAAGKEQRFAVGGYLQSQVEFGSAPDNRFAGINDRFLIRRARLNVAGRFVEQFDFKLEGDFGNNSIAGKTGYSAQLTDGFINWNRYDFANIKFGQIVRAHV